MRNTETEQKQNGKSEHHSKDKKETQQWNQKHKYKPETQQQELKVERLDPYGNGNEKLGDVYTKRNMSLNESPDAFMCADFNQKLSCSVISDCRASPWLCEHWKRA